VTVKLANYAVVGDNAGTLVHNKTKLKKVEWFRWAKVLRTKVWSKYLLRPKFSWTLV